MDLDLDLIDPSVARALAHPLRAKILAAMEAGVASPKELSRALGEPLGNVSYHVGILVELGLITLVRETPRRGAVEHHYTAKAPRKRRAAAWDGLPRSARRAAAPEIAARVAKSFTDAAASGGFDRAHSRIGVARAQVDAEGWRAVARELDAFSARVAEIERESRARVGEGAEIAAVVVTGLAETGVSPQSESARRPSRPRRGR